MCFRECSRKERERWGNKTTGEQNVHYLQLQSGPQPGSAQDLSVASKNCCFMQNSALPALSLKPFLVGFSVASDGLHRSKGLKALSSITHGSSMA